MKTNERNRNNINYDEKQNQIKENQLKFSLRSSDYRSIVYGFPISI